MQFIIARHNCVVMKTHICFWWGCVGALASLMAQENPSSVQGTVTLPYETLRALEREKKSPLPSDKPLTLLQSAQYRVDLSTAPATITATMRVQQFSEGWASTALLPGDVSIADLQPADTPLQVKQEMLQLITQQQGKIELTFRMFTSQPDSFLTLPCASATISFSGLKQGAVLECKIDGVVQALRGNGTISIPARGGLLSWQEVAPASVETLPPSVWTWRHEVVVVEQDGRLSMNSFSQAETTAGDTAEAQLLLPAGVSHIETSGEHLEPMSVQRLADGTQRLVLRWKGDRQLTRAVELRYQKRVSALQDAWLLEAPRGNAEKADLAQFHLADQAQRKFSGDGISGPFAPQTLSKTMQKCLQGQAYFLIDAPQGQASIQQNIMPIASTADAMITKARWDSRIELDGATLTTGQLEVQYRNGARLPLRLPEKAVLLSCSANEIEIAPVIAAPGLLEISLPAQDRSMVTTKLTISYTERMEKFAPLEGQMSLRLPGTSYFINSLQWQLVLPAEYTAEVAGNLTRPTSGSTQANIILLEKNLCRDETPQAEIFYNRNNKLNR